VVFVVCYFLSVGEGVGLAIGTLVKRYIGKNVPTVTEKSVMIGPQKKEKSGRTNTKRSVRQGQNSSFDREVLTKVIEHLRCEHRSARVRLPPWNAALRRDPHYRRVGVFFLANIKGFIRILA
jgi:hypothetical protein